MEFGRRIAIDAAGNAYLTGQTKSSNFPVTGNAFDRTINIPPNCPRCATDVTDGFVTKLNATGSALVYSTYLGGTDYDSPRGIAVDAGGNAYVIGETLSPDFPTTAGAFRRTYSGNYDIFVTKLNAAGSALAYSTFIGGTQVDNGERVAVDAGGNAYVMGFSSSLDFPTTAGAFDRTNSGDFDVTLTKLNQSGSAPGLLHVSGRAGQRHGRRPRRQRRGRGLCERRHRIPGLPDDGWRAAHDARRERQLRDEVQRRRFGARLFRGVWRQRQVRAPAGSTSMPRAMPGSRAARIPRTIRRRRMPLIDR